MCTVVLLCLTLAPLPLRPPPPPSPPSGPAPCPRSSLPVRFGPQQALSKPKTPRMGADVAVKSGGWVCRSLPFPFSNLKPLFCRRLPRPPFPPPPFRTLPRPPFPRAPLPSLPVSSFPRPPNWLGIGGRSSDRHRVLPPHPSPAAHIAHIGRFVGELSNFCVYDIDTVSTVLFSPVLLLCPLRLGSGG